MKLLHHNYIDQTVPDAMHTVKDVTEHLLKLITGGEDSQKVCASELALSRSFEVVPSPRSSAPATQQRGRQRDTALPAATFHLNSCACQMTIRVLLFPHIFFCH